MPISLFDFLQQFPNEQSAIDYVLHERWGSDGEVTCPKCGTIGVKFYQLANGRLKCADCRQAFSVRVGTIFEDSKIPLQKWFLVIYLATSLKKGISSVQVSKYLGITQKSAWFMLHRIRHVVESGGDFLSGEVEIDETYVGGKFGNRAYRKPRPKEVVFGMVERNDENQPGKVRIRHVKTNGARVLLPQIAQNIAPGSTIYSDQLPSYRTLAHRGYYHGIVNHSARQYVDGNNYTQNIENIWSQLKRSVFGVYHQISPKHLQLYCNEVEFRYNTRYLSDGERFDLWFKRIETRLTYKALLARPKSLLLVPQE